MNGPPSKAQKSIRQNINETERLAVMNNAQVTQQMFRTGLEPALFALQRSNQSTIYTAVLCSIPLSNHREDDMYSCTVCVPAV